MESLGLLRDFRKIGILTWDFKFLSKRLEKTKEQRMKKESVLDHKIASLAS